MHPVVQNISFKQNKSAQSIEFRLIERRRAYFDFPSTRLVGEPSEEQREILHVNRRCQSMQNRRKMEASTIRISPILNCNKKINYHWLLNYFKIVLPP